MKVDVFEALPYESSGDVLLFVDIVLCRDRLKKREAKQKFGVPCTSAESSWLEILYGDAVVGGCFMRPRKRH